jgi:hypothetical protein
MTWASVGSLGSNQDKTSGSVIVLTTTATAEVGNVILVAIAADNINTTDGDHSEVSSVVDSAGNTYTKLKEQTNGQGAAGDGATVSLWQAKVTTQLNSGGTITANLASAVTAQAITAWEFTVTAGATISVEGSDAAVGDGADPAVMTISGLPSQEYLFVAAHADENPNSGTYTKDADYTALDKNGTTGGSGATNIYVAGGWRIFTGTGDTYDAATSAARDHAQVYVALKEAAGGGGGTDNLTADGITTGAPTLGTPTLAQTQALTAATISTGAPTLGLPTLAQVQALTAAGFTTGAPTLGAPTLTQGQALAAEGITTGAPTLGTPTLGQAHALTAVSITTGAPTLGTPTLAQAQTLTAAGITTGAPTLGTPTLSTEGTDSLTTEGITTGAPTLGAPTLTQVQALGAVTITAGAPTLGTPGLTQAHSLSAAGIAAPAPIFTAPVLAQTHLLIAAGLVTGAPVLGSPILGDGSGVLSDPVIHGETRAVLTTSGRVSGGLRRNGRTRARDT